MKKLTVLILTIVFMSISSLAIAGKDSGPYIGASLGYSSLDVAFDQISQGHDDNDNGFKVFAGYNFGLVPMFDFAVEGSYIDFGGTETVLVQGLSFDITGYDVFGLACYNIGPVGIFGKVGNVWWKMDSGIAEFDESSSDMAYGIGVKVQFSSIAVRAEYERFEFDVDNVANVDLDFISVGVSWTF